MPRPFQYMLILMKDNTISNFQYGTHVLVLVITLWKREKNVYVITYSLSNTALLKTWL